MFDLCIELYLQPDKGPYGPPLEEIRRHRNRFEDEATHATLLQGSQSEAAHLQQASKFKEHAMIDVWMFGIVCCEILRLGSLRHENRPLADTVDEWATKKKKWLPYEGMWHMFTIPLFDENVYDDTTLAKACLEAWCVPRDGV